MGVAVPPGFVVHPNDDATNCWPATPALPVIAKPAWEGSGKGADKSLVERPEDLAAPWGLPGSSPAGAR
jgi:hypothetical protein